jgi:hypothetical protein
MRQFTHNGYTIRAGDYIEIWKENMPHHIVGKVSCISRRFVHISDIIFIGEDGYIECNPNTIERDSKRSLIESYKIKKINPAEYFSIII